MSEDATTPTSPRPWRVIRAFEDEPARVIDSNDEDVAVELTDADAALIVDAVNERDRLRDLVRRMATQLSRSCPEKFGDWTREGDNACSLIAEARAAIGEGKE